MSGYPSYVLVTAARNEAQFIELTIKSVISQTIKPLRWIIVSDASTDATDEIVSRYAAHYEWLRLLRLGQPHERSFSGKAVAVAAGVRAAADLSYEIIGNLDADISFDPDYLQYILLQFWRNPRLGVAGTPYRESNQMHDDRLKSPDHVSGACQMFRRECFEAIGGYLQIKTGGIDLIAVLSAKAKGWDTRRFEEKVCFHHRNVGSGQHANLWARFVNRGRKDYLLGSHPLFQTLRSVYQMKSRPVILGGILMLYGYFAAMLLRVEKSMPPECIALRQADQLERLKDLLRHPVKHVADRLAAAPRL
jgi:glycosyltransferase involved in cell wall biosynthesis